MSEWISVKDRLPEVSGIYLVCSSNLKYPEIVWFNKEYQGWEYSIPVTFWMPVPNKPEEVS